MGCGASTNQVQPLEHAGRDALAPSPHNRTHDIEADKSAGSAKLEGASGTQELTPPSSKLVDAVPRVSSGLRPAESATSQPTPSLGRGDGDRAAEVATSPLSQPSRPDSAAGASNASSAAAVEQPKQPELGVVDVAKTGAAADSSSSPSSPAPPQQGAPPRSAPPSPAFAAAEPPPLQEPLLPPPSPSRSISVPTETTVEPFGGDVATSPSSASTAPAQTPIIPPATQLAGASVSRPPSPTPTAALTGTATDAGPTAGPAPPPSEPPQRFAAIHVRRTMTVRGLDSPVSELCCKAADPEPGMADELVELMRVWREEWYCFPTWWQVLATRKSLLKADGMWSRMSNPERRLACEATIFVDYGEDLLQLLKRCAERRRQAAEAAMAPATGTSGHEGQAAPQAEASTSPQPPPQEGQEGAEAAHHFFITADFLELFVKVHELTHVPEGPGSHGRPGSLQGLGRVVGRTHNLTLRQVYERIVRPALEASGGMSYAEAFVSEESSFGAPVLSFSVVRSGGEQPEPPPGDRQGRAGSRPKGVQRRMSDSEQRDLNRTLVPHAMWDGGLTVPQLAEALDRSPFKYGCFWVDLFCSAAAPPPPSVPGARAGPQGTAAAAAAAEIAPAAVLARCKVAALPTPWKGWPLAPPGAVLCAATAAGVVRAVRKHGLKVAVVLIDPPELPQTTILTTEARDLDEEAAEIKAAVAALAAAEEPPALPPTGPPPAPPQREAGGKAPGASPEGNPGGSSNGGGSADTCATDGGSDCAGSAAVVGGRKGAAAVRKMWKLYREGALGLVEQMVEDLSDVEKEHGKYLRCDHVRSRMAIKREVAAGAEADAAATQAALGPPFGQAVIRVASVARLEALPLLDAAAAGNAAGLVTSPPPPVLLAEAVLDEQLLRCPVGMSQAEADELVGVWATQWGCRPDLATVMLARAACGGGGGGGGGDGDGDGDGETGRCSANLWASMSYGQRRTACELLLLYGSRTAAVATAAFYKARTDWSAYDMDKHLPPRPEPTVPPADAARWRPGAEAEAEGRAASSRGAFVSVEFLEHFMAAHNLTEPRRPLMASYPGQAVWNPCTDTPLDVTTSWVCANIVLPATQAYGMAYSDLLLSAEAQAALLPPARDGRQRRFCVHADEAPQRAFASHAWATPFREFVQTLSTEPKNAYWIDIFHKNQHQSVAVSDLADNLRLSGQVALVIHPFPAPLVLTRVWCLFEIMTALQVGVPISLLKSPAALKGFEEKIVRGATGYDGIATAEITPEVLADVESLDVSTAQATVPADKELILGMIRDSIGVQDMNRQVKELIMSLLHRVRDELEKKQQQILASLPSCFAGDGIVRVYTPAPLDPTWQQLPPRQPPAGGRATWTAAAAHASLTAAGTAVDATVREADAAVGAAGIADGPCGRLVLRRVAELAPGDLVVTGEGRLSRVVLVTRDEVGPQGVEVCELRGGAGGASATGQGDGSCGSEGAVVAQHKGTRDARRELPAGASDSGSGSGGGGSISPSVPAPPCPPPSRLLVTPDHPVLVDGVWVLPRSLTPPVRLAREQVPYGCVYNLELDPPGSLCVSGVRLVALGQDLSGQRSVGVTPESCELYGWGWRRNPDRARYMAEQQAREAERLLKRGVPNLQEWAEFERAEEEQPGTGTTGPEQGGEEVVSDLQEWHGGMGTWSGAAKAGVERRRRGWRRRRGAARLAGTSVVVLKVVRRSGERLPSSGR